MKTLIIYFFTILCSISTTGFSQAAIHVQTTGDGQPILLLPGFANSSEVWDETLPHLQGNYQFHRVDYAGFNGIAPVESDWLSQVKEALLAYIKDEKLSDITIIGHSLGGTLALYLASEIQEKVKKIIVVDALPNTAKLMFPGQSTGSFSYDNPYAQAQLNMADESFEQMVTQQTKMMCKNTDKHEQIKKWMLNTDRKTYVHGYIDYLNFDATPYLKNINSAVYLLSGTTFGMEQSKQVYETQYEELQDYELKFAQNAAHYIMFDQPEWFYKKINKILNNE